MSLVHRSFLTGLFKSDTSRGALEAFNYNPVPGPGFGFRSSKVDPELAAYRARRSGRNRAQRQARRKTRIHRKGAR